LAQNTDAEKAAIDAGFELMLLIMGMIPKRKSKRFAELVMYFRSHKAACAKATESSYQQRPTLVESILLIA
jgi:hypothetical protein